MFKRKTQIKEFDNGFWRNTYWETEDENVFLVEIASSRKGIFEVAVFNGYDVINDIEALGYLKILHERVTIMNKTSRSTKKLITLIAEKKYPNHEKKLHKVYLINRPIHGLHDFRLQNITIVTKDAYNYDEQLKPILEEMGRLRVDKAIKKGVFKERMSAEYSNKLRDKSIESRREDSILNEEDVAAIRELSKIESQSFIADKYKLARATIADIINYRIWNEHAFSPEDMYFLTDSEYVEVRLTLKEYDKKTHEFLMKNDVKKEIYNFNNDYQYILKKQVDDQICLFKFDTEGNYVSDCHIRFIKPSHRNDWRNFTIISMRGNHKKGGYMNREEIYNVLYSINNYFSENE